VPGCRFDPAVLQCKGEKTDQCLTAAQVKALKRHMSGPVDSKGNRLAVDWPWDAGIAAPGWRGRPLGTPDASRRNNASAIFLGGAAQAYLFSTPPVTPGLNSKDPNETRKEIVRYVLAYDFDKDPASLSARNAEFPQSAIEWDVADSTDLTKFKSQGRKMIVYHGGSDPSWSLNDTLRWYTELEKRDPKVRDFARFFIVPGLNHCYGGPAMEKADFLTPLTEWVEHGKAPERIVGTAKVADDVPWPGRSRPFCVYPKQARYKGDGSIEVAENFVCR
jgi:feruloyl esterase